MAWDSPYATAEEYRARVEKAATGEDTEIDAQLEGVSRFIEREAGRVFNQSDPDTVRYFDGNGGVHVYVDDVVTLTALEVDIDASGSWETAVASASLLLKPYHASEIGQPYTCIELAPWQTTISRFPARPKAIKVTGVWGWPAVPGGIKEGVIGITRQLRDLHKAGFTATLESVDMLVRQSPQASFLLRDILREYRRRALFA
jgi:hypothetical protein